ncbi:MAG: carbonic anhydrase [Acidobacteriia bacterium]|jgi:carbonic anhydrase|nr:carbonic anhydrase [Terriglobia bacterium]
MTLFDQLLENNRRYAESFRLGELPIPPAKKLAVVTCIDARLTVEKLLGIETGDAHIIRNAGGLATDDALRSLILSTQVLGTRTVAVIQHTDCGMLKFSEAELQQRIQQATGQDTSGLRFLVFSDLEQSLAEQVRRIRSNPFLPRDLQVRGYIYDVRSGRLRELVA